MTLTINNGVNEKATIDISYYLRLKIIRCQFHSKNHVMYSTPYYIMVVLLSNSLDHCFVLLDNACSLFPIHDPSSQYMKLHDLLNTVNNVYDDSKFKKVKT